MERVGFAAASALALFYVSLRARRSHPGCASPSELKCSFARCKPTDWQYIAEGALNLALRYCGNDPNLVGIVLRVRKNNPEASGGVVDHRPWKESLRFVENIILPLLGRRYVQPAIEVEFRKGFMRELAESIEDSRPVARRKNHLDYELESGLLMLDNTCIPVGDGPTICFELKIKCGFCPDSPFVTHEVKKRVDRFTMHQQLKNSQGKLDTVSRYSPVDLFSYDEPRVIKALQALVATPQNNFRMFVDGALVFPDKKGHGSKQGLEEILKKYPQVRGGVDGLLTELAEVLVREPLLDRIKKVQMLDDCDIEGTWPLYQKIVERNERVLPLADGKAIFPRDPPKQPPTDAVTQHDTVRRFMLSCTAKDCSVMLSLKPTGGADKKTSIGETSLGFHYRPQNHCGWFSRLFLLDCNRGLGSKAA
mmetsp:Transcript_23130/g.50520  ORF Transcript_23130/g.50520 Transcript_23130/m.50520 type:complete len:422 (+) Transcript_23130:97-1362(+)